MLRILRKFPRKGLHIPIIVNPFICQVAVLAAKKSYFLPGFQGREELLRFTPKKVLAIMKISTTQGKKCSFLRGNQRTTLPSSDNIFLSYDLSNPFCRKPLKQYNLQRFIYNLPRIWQNETFLSTKQTKLKNIRIRK